MIFSKKAGFRIGIFLFSVNLAVACSVSKVDLESQIKSLDGPKTQRQKAEGFIRSKGLYGMDALFYVSRSIGDEDMLSLALQQLKCGAGIRPFYFEREPLVAITTRTAEKWLEDDHEMFLKMVRSEDPVKRSFAIISQSGDPHKFIDALKFLRKESDPFVIRWGLIMGYTCTIFRISKAKDRDRNIKLLENSVKEVSKNFLKNYDPSKSPPGPDSKKHLDCSAPDFSALEHIAKLIESGSVNQGAESWTNEKLDISFSVGPLRGDIDSQCALRLYKKVSEKGKHPWWLLMPLVGNLGFTPLGPRTEAANLLLRDIDYFPNKRRNKILSSAIVAGAKTDLKPGIENSPGSQDYIVLSAAVIQGDERAKKILENNFYCQEMEFLEPSILGFSKAPDAADRAYFIAEKCTALAKPGAFEALLRLHDPRTTQVFDEIAKSGFKYTESHFIRTLAELDNPEILSRLKKLVEGGDSKAKRILEKVKRARNIFSLGKTGEDKGEGK